MILIHHPCPNKVQSEAAITLAAPSLGFWQLLLTTFGFVYRSAAGGGFRGCLSAAFAHIVMLAAAAELLAVLSSPNVAGDVVIGDGEEVCMREHMALGPMAASGFPTVMSPTGWAGQGSRHGAGSPQPVPPWRSGHQARSPANRAIAAAGAGGGPHRRRRTSLPPFFEGCEHELAHLLPPEAQRGGDSALPTRASCPVVPYAVGNGRRNTTLLRSASAAAVSAPWNGGVRGNDCGNGSGGAAGGSAGPYPSMFAISASPIRWSAGRSRKQAAVPPSGLEVDAAGRADGVGWAEEDSLADGTSPDGQSPHSQQLQQWQKPYRQGSRSSARALRATAAGTGTGQVAGCDGDADGSVRSATGDGNGQSGAEPGGGDARAGASAAAPVAEGEGEQHEPWPVRVDEGADLRVSAATDGQPRLRYRRETGNSTHEYILLASTTVPGTDDGAGHGSRFSGDNEEDEEQAHDDDADDDDGDEEDYDSDQYRDDDNDDGYDYDEEEDAEGGGDSDGCFSLVIDNNGAPLGDCMVGVNRTCPRAQGQAQQDAVATAAAAVAAWVDAGAAAAAAGAFRGLMESDRTATGDYAAAADTWPAAEGIVVTHKLAHARDGGPDIQRGCTRLSSRARGAAARHRRGGGVGVGGPSTAHGAQGCATGGPSGDAALAAFSARGIGAVPPTRLPLRRHSPNPVVVRQALPDPYGCDVADMADFEDLMSLEEEEEEQAVVAVPAAEAAMGLTDGTTAPASASIAHGQPGASTTTLGGGGGGDVEELYSNLGVFWPSSSAVTSEARLNGGRPLPQPHQQPRQLHRGPPLGGSSQRKDSAASCVVAGGSGDGGWTVCASLQQKEQQQGANHHVDSVQDGDEDERRAGFVPLQAETLARHTAAIRADERQRVQQQQQELGEQRLQLLWWQGAEGGPDGSSGGPEAAHGLLPGAAPARGLLDSFLHDAALLAARAKGCDEAPPADCVGVGAPGQMSWPPGKEPAVAAAAPPGHRRQPHDPREVRVRRHHHHHHHRRCGDERQMHMAQDSKPQRVARRREFSAVQPSCGAEFDLLSPPPQQQQCPAAQEEQPQLLKHGPHGQSCRRPQQQQQQQPPERSRGPLRRSQHVRQLSAGQLLAREVISRYDQDYGYMYGNMLQEQLPPGYDAYHPSQPAACPWQQQQQRPSLNCSAVPAAVTASPRGASPLTEEGLGLCDDDLLETFELSGFEEPQHMAPPPPSPPAQQHHHHQRGQLDGTCLPQPYGPTDSLSARVWVWLGPPGNPAAASAAAVNGPCAWGVPGAAAGVEWYDAVSSGGGWGAANTSAAAAALLGSPQQLGCTTAVTSANAGAAAAAVAAASAPSTPPTTVVEPFSAAGQEQAVYRSLSGTRRYEEVDPQRGTRRGVSDNYKAALAAAAAAGNRSGPTTPVKPPESLPPAAAGAADGASSAAREQTTSLSHSASMTPLQATSGEQEEPGTAAAAVTVEPRRRLPAGVAGGGSASRALFPGPENSTMPLSHSAAAPRGESAVKSPAGALGFLVSERPDASTAAAAEASMARQEGGEGRAGAVALEAVDVTHMADDEAMVGEGVEGDLGGVLAAASGSTGMLSRLTIPSEVWLGQYNGGAGGGGGPACGPGAVSPYVRCSWAAASELGDDGMEAGGDGASCGGASGSIKRLDAGAGLDLALDSVTGPLGGLGADGEPTSAVPKAAAGGALEAALDDGGADRRAAAGHVVEGS